MLAGAGGLHVNDSQLRFLLQITACVSSPCVCEHVKQNRGLMLHVKLDILLSRADCKQVIWNMWPQSD